MANKPLEDWTYEELIDYASSYILKQFISEGGKGFRNAVGLMLNLAVDWRYPRNKKAIDKANKSA